MASGPITSWQMDGETKETVTDFIFLGSKITADGDCTHEIKRCLLLGRKVMINLDSIVKSRDITLPTKVCLVKAMVFPVVMWELDCEKSWAPKNCCFWTVVLEKTLDSPLESKDIKPVIPKRNWPWIFFGGTDAEAESLIVWPPDVKNWLTGKDPDALVLLGEVNSCGKCQLLRILPVGCSNASQPSFLFSTWSDCWLILRKEFSNLTEHQIHLKGLKTCNPTPKFLNRAWPENLIF